MAIDLPTGYAAICSRSAKSHSALGMTRDCVYGDVFRRPGERFRLRWLSRRLKGDPSNGIYHFFKAYGETAGSANVGHDRRKEIFATFFGNILRFDSLVVL